MLIISKAPCTEKRDYRLRLAYTQFVKWCVQKAVSPQPVSQFTVAGFLVEFCVNLGGSTASLEGKLSNLRMYCKENEKGWLPELGVAFVKRVVKVLKYDDYTKSNRKAAIQMKLLHDMIELRGVTGSLLGMVLAAAYSLHHDGIMRSGEGTSGLLHSEVKNEAFVDHKGVDRQALEVEIDRTKTHRAGDPKKIIVSDYDHQWSAFKCVNRLKRIAGAGMKSDQFLFPQVTFKRGVPDDLDWSKSLSYAALVKCIKHDVAKCGMDPTDFSGHSFRAGGATDLFASGKLTFAQIMKLGRWRSIEACMMYYREDLEVSGRAGEVFGTQAAESFARTTR